MGEEKKIKEEQTTVRIKKSIHEVVSKHVKDQKKVIGGFYEDAALEKMEKEKSNKKQ